MWRSRKIMLTMLVGNCELGSVMLRQPQVECPLWSFATKALNFSTREIQHRDLRWLLLRNLFLAKILSPGSLQEVTHR